MTTPIIRPKKRNIVKYNAYNGNWYAADYDDPTELGQDQGQFKTTGQRISEEEARATIGDQRMELLMRNASKPKFLGKTLSTTNLEAINTPEENRIEEAQRLYPGRQKMKLDTDELIRQIKSAMSMPGGALLQDNY